MGDVEDVGEMFVVDYCRIQDFADCNVGPISYSRVRKARQLLLWRKVDFVILMDVCIFRVASLASLAVVEEDAYGHLIDGDQFKL